MSTFDNVQFNTAWPSLYPPAKEVGFLGPPVRPGGYYLSDPDDIFKFTLYWTLIFHLPFSFIAGIYALLNFSFPPAKSAGAAIVLTSSVAHPHDHTHTRSRSRSQSQSQSYTPFGPQSQSHSRRESESDAQLHGDADTWQTPPRTNVRRSRLTFALLVLLTFLGATLLRAVVSASVIAFVLYGVYRAGGFYMSTWIPFVWAVIQSLIALLEIWPSIIDII